MRVRQELINELEAVREELTKARTREREAESAYNASLRGLSKCMSETHALEFKLDAVRSKLDLLEILQEEVQHDTGEESGNRLVHQEQQGHGQITIGQELDEAVQCTFTIQKVQTAHRS